MKSKNRLQGVKCGIIWLWRFLLNLIVFDDGGVNSEDDGKKIDSIGTHHFFGVLLTEMCYLPRGATARDFTVIWLWRSLLNLIVFDYGGVDSPEC